MAKFPIGDETGPEGKGGLFEARGKKHSRKGKRSKKRGKGRKKGSRK